MYPPPPLPLALSIQEGDVYLARLDSGSSAVPDREAVFIQVLRTVQVAHNITAQGGGATGYLHHPSILPSFLPSTSV